MPAHFICRMVDANNGIVKLHLNLQDGEQNDGYFNVTPDVMSQICNVRPRVGDEIRVTLSVIGRAGSNGAKQTHGDPS